MLRFLEQNGYTLVVPGPADEQWLANTIAEGRKMNGETLASLDKPPEGGKPAEGGRPPRGGRLTGSFIYSHPPDYIDSDRGIGAGSSSGDILPSHHVVWPETSHTVRLAFGLDGHL